MGTNSDIENVTMRAKTTLIILQELKQQLAFAASCVCWDINKGLYMKMALTPICYDKNVTTMAARGNAYTFFRGPQLASCKLSVAIQNYSQNQQHSAREEGQNPQYRLWVAKRDAPLQYGKCQRKL